MVTINPRPRFHVTFETNKLVELIATMTEAQLLSYAALSQACGEDVCGRARSCLTSARKIAERDYGIVTVCVTKMGIRRCVNDEIPVLLETTISQADRKIKRGIQTVLRTDTDQLSEAHKSRLNGSLQRATLATMAFDPTQTAIGAARVMLDQTQVPLSIADDLKRLLDFNSKKR
jgi:hypothetical protein